MWRNALFGTLAIVAGFIMFAMAQLDFLIPYKRAAWRMHGAGALIYLALFSVNLFGLFLWLSRKLLLKDTGRKLDHMERQLRSGEVAQDLGERLREVD